MSKWSAFCANKKNAEPLLHQTCASPKCANANTACSLSRRHWPSSLRLDAGAIFGGQKQTQFTDVHHLWNCSYDSGVSITRNIPLNGSHTAPGTILSVASPGHPNRNGTRTWVQLVQREGGNCFPLKNMFQLIDYQIF